MSHFIAFGREVFLVVFVHGREDGDLIDDFELESSEVEGFGFFGVVGEQSDFAEAEVLEDLQSDAVISHVGFEAESVIGFDSVHPLVLKSVGPDFLCEPDSSAFLGQVDEDAVPFAGDHFESEVKLIAAIAAE